MLGAILDIMGNVIEAMADAFPCETMANVALLVGGVGLLLTGGRHLAGGILSLFAAFGAVVNALITFLGALLIAFGATARGLIFLIVGGMAIWCAFLLLGGG